MNFFKEYDTNYCFSDDQLTIKLYHKTEEAKDREISITGEQLIDCLIDLNYLEKEDSYPADLWVQDHMSDKVAKDIATMVSLGQLEKEPEKEWQKTLRELRELIAVSKYHIEMQKVA